MHLHSHNPLARSALSFLIYANLRQNSVRGNLYFLSTGRPGLVGHGALRRRCSTQAPPGCARPTWTLTAGSVRSSLRAPTPTLAGRARSPAAAYIYVHHGAGGARHRARAPVGGGGAVEEDLLKIALSR